MYKQTLAAVCVMASLAGCAHTKVENPVDFVTYRNEPLVKQVDNGMTMQQVIAIGGTPSGVIDGNGKTSAGACNNYVLNTDGKQQAYYVSFNGSGLVDSKGFMTCTQHKANVQAMP